MKTKSSTFCSLISRGILSASLLIGASVVSYAQVTSYDAFSAAQWFQTGDNPSFTEDNAYGWFFSGHVNLTGAGDANTGTLATGGTSSPFILGNNNGTLLFQTGYYASRSGMELDFPSGQTYTYLINGGGLAAQSGNLAVPSSLPYPSAIPTFSNLSSFSGLDPNAAVFQWNSWTPPTPASREYFDIRNPYGTVIYSTLFNTSQTAFTVPNGVLSAGNAYSVEVIFSSRLDNGLGQWGGTGAPALGGWDYRTSANFSTVPEPSATGAVVGLAICAFAIARQLRRRQPF